MSPDSAMQGQSLKPARPLKLQGGGAPAAWQRRLEHAVSKAACLQRRQARSPLLAAPLPLSRVPLWGERLSEAVQDEPPQGQKSAAAASKPGQGSASPQQAAPLSQAQHPGKDRPRPAAQRWQGRWGKGKPKAVAKQQPPTRLSPRADGALLERKAGKDAAAPSPAGRPRQRLPKAALIEANPRPVPDKAGFAACLERASGRVLGSLQEETPLLRKPGKAPSKSALPARLQPPAEFWERPLQGAQAPDGLLCRAASDSKQPPAESAPSIGDSPLQAAHDSPPPTGDSHRKESDKPEESIEDSCRQQRGRCPRQAGDSHRESPSRTGDSHRENPAPGQGLDWLQAPGHGWKGPVQGPQAPGELISRLAAACHQTASESSAAIGDSHRHAIGDSHRQDGHRDGERQRRGQAREAPGAIGDSPRTKKDQRSRTLGPAGGAPRAVEKNFEKGSDSGLGAGAESLGAPFESPAGQPRPTDWAGACAQQPAGTGLGIDSAAASPPADLHVLASQIQRILDEEARRHGIDV